LGGVAGLGVAGFEILGHILGWKSDGAGASGEGDTVVGVDCGDGPVVAVNTPTEAGSVVVDPGFSTLRGLAGRA
jgi:hypothetical protein